MVAYYEKNKSFKFIQHTFMRMIKGVNENYQI